MRACLDACVLVPTALRGILMRTADAGAFEPVWSERIFEEWRRADLKLNPNANLGVEQALLKDKWRSATVYPDVGLEKSIALPDENDVHVLAAAVSGQAELLVTANLRDFPINAMSRFGIGLRHPDAFLLELLEDWFDAVSLAIDAEYDAAKTATGEEFTKRAFLKRIGLPRVSKRLT